jgi:hypothetical protein
LGVVVGVVVVEVALAGELGDPEGEYRVLKMLLGCGKRFLLGVDRPTAGAKYDLAYGVLDAVLEEADRAQHLDVCIEEWLPNRAPYVHLGRLVRECLRLEIPEDLLAPGADIYLVESRLLRHVLAFASREGDDDGNLVAASEEAVGGVRPDETGSASRQDPHLTRPQDILGESLEGSVQSFACRYARLRAQNLPHAGYVWATTLWVVLVEGLVDKLAFAAGDFCYHLGDVAAHANPDGVADPVA